MTALFATAWPFPEIIVERWGWMLVHSIWQCALVAVLSSLITRGMRNRGATARYAVLVGALGLAVAAPAATWCIQPTRLPNQPKENVAAFQPPVTTATAAAINREVPPLPVQVGDVDLGGRLADFPESTIEPPLQPDPAQVTADKNWSERIKTALRPWLAWIVASWIGGVMLVSLRPLLGWYTLRRLQRVGVSPVPVRVEEAFKRSAARIGTRRAVCVLQSTLARVPVVVGYLRPVILLPVSFLTSIPTGQLEAILAHELAHVRRHDFAVNLLQTLAETLLFYHPAIWWLSHQVRVEREHCCDDLVIELLGNRVEYGRALLAIEELRGHESVFALGATDGSLLARVRRIAGVRADRAPLSLLDRLPAMLLALVLLGTTGVLAMNGTFAQGANSADAEALADQFASALREIKLPYLDEEGCQQLGNEVLEAVAPHLAEPLSKVQRQRLLDGITASVERDFDPADGDRLYLEFRNRLETFKWKLAIAVSRPTLTEAQLKQRAEQREWMRGEIEKIAESPTTGYQRDTAYKALEALFADPLHPVFQVPMNDTDYAAFEQAYANSLERLPAEFRLPLAVVQMAQAAITVSMDDLRQQWPMTPTGWGMHNLQWVLKFSQTDGDRAFILADVNGQARNLYLDCLQNELLGDMAPQLLADRKQWLEQQGRGDLAYDAKADALVAVRDANFAVLPAKDWYAADQATLADLRKLLQTDRKAAVPLAEFLAAPAEGADGGRQARKDAPALVVQTADGSISVIRVTMVANNMAVVVSRRRPLPANLPIHPGDAEPLGKIHKDHQLVSVVDQPAVENNAKDQPALPVAVEPAFVLLDHLNVMAVGFHPDGKRLIGVSIEKDVAFRHWNTSEKKLIREVRLDSDQHGNHFLNSHLTVSADGRSVLGIMGDQVGIWDSETGKLKTSLTQPADAHLGMLQGLACSVDPGRVACGVTPGFGGLGSNDAHAMVWDVATGKLLQTVKHRGAVQTQSIALSNDGKWLATGGQQEGTCIWDVSTGKLLHALPNANPGRKHPDGDVSDAGANQVLALAFSPDRRLLAIADMLGVKLIDVQTGKVLQQIDAPFRMGRANFVFSADGKLLARVGTDKTIPIWSVESGKPFVELPSESHGGAFSPDGRWFAAGLTDKDNGIRVWQLRDGVAGDGANSAIDGNRVDPLDYEDMDARNEEVFARKISLTAEAMPLNEAVAAVARAAGLELRFDSDALQQVGVNVDRKVTVRFQDVTLNDALAELMQWFKRGPFGPVRQLQGNRLVITTLQGITAVEEAKNRHLPDWLQQPQNQAMAASLDDDHQVISVSTGEALTDEMLAKLKSLPRLRELNIGRTTHVTPAGLAHLADLASLRKLTLYEVHHDGNGLGDSTIEAIVGLKSLRELSISSCGVTDAGVEWLARMPWLRRLTLTNELGLTNKSLASIGRMKQLKFLDLSGYRSTADGGPGGFSKEGFLQLAGLKELEILHLTGHDLPAEALVFPRLKSLSLGTSLLRGLGDDCAEQIAKCRDLRSLHLRFTSISDEGLSKIAELPHLSRLDLDSYVVTDAGIEHFERSTSLKHVSLRASQLTDASLKSLAEIKTLTRIDLSGSGRPGSEIGRCFTVAGVQQLKDLPQLRGLWLSNFDSDGSYLGLKELRQLHSLILHFVTIRDDELETLMDAMPETRVSASDGRGVRRLGL